MTNTTDSGSTLLPDLSKVRAMAMALEVEAQQRADRAEDDAPYDWTDMEVARRFIAVVRRAKAWARDDHSLVCSVQGLDDHIWGHVASELLDRISNDFLPGETIMTTGLITELAQGLAVLTW